MAQTPKHDLKDVFERIDKCIFNVAEKSLFAVITVKKHQGNSMSTAQAESWIKDHLQTLSTEDFCERNTMWGDSSCVADVYLKTIEDVDWYIKFYIDDEYLEEVSFHPLEKEGVTVSGKKFKQGSWTYEKESTMWRVRE